MALWSLMLERERARQMKQRHPSERQPLPQAPTPGKRPRKSFPWRALEQQVVRMQKQIQHASARGDKQAVYQLQQRLMESEAARLLAVRRVAEENQGKDTAGVDGVKSLGPAERLAMASLIHPRNWDQQLPLPVRRIWVPKPGTTERRPLAILPMIDRCKQALVKLALEPEWEAHFEAHSYGFRPGRGVHDAITAILVAIEGQPSFVLTGDIEGAFDHIDQAVVLDKLQTFPALRRAISAWLTAGVIDGTTYLPSETGIAQGGVLSPLLMNVALHGMEAVVAGGGVARERPLLVRYADNFVMIHPDLTVLQQATRRVSRWLAAMGLQLHADKTRITHTLTPSQGQVGFEFLGFSIRQEWKDSRLPERRGHQPIPGAQVMASARLLRLVPQARAVRVQTIITPGQQASERHLAVISQRVQQLQTAPQAQVIKELNPLIASWAAYYNGIVEDAILSRYDALLEEQLMHWASRRHPGKTREWLLARYWHATRERKRVFATVDGVQLRAYRQARILKGEGKEL
jgi:RNA-directed DNA polymerase